MAYPVDAKDCPKGREVEHSLRKWRGLRREVLDEHGLELTPLNEIGRAHV